LTRLWQPLRFLQPEEFSVGIGFRDCFTGQWVQPILTQVFQGFCSGNFNHTTGGYETGFTNDVQPACPGKFISAKLTNYKGATFPDAQEKCTKEK